MEVDDHFFKFVQEFVSWISKYLIENMSMVASSSPRKSTALAIMRELMMTCEDNKAFYTACSSHITVDTTRALMPLITDNYEDVREASVLLLTSQMFAAHAHEAASHNCEVSVHKNSVEVSYVINEVTVRFDHR